MKHLQRIVTVVGLIISASAFAEIPNIDGLWKGEARIADEQGVEETCSVSYEINFVQGASYTFSSNINCESFQHSKSGNYAKVGDEYIWEEGYGKGALTEVEEMNRINHAYLSDDAKTIYTYMIEYEKAPEGVLGIRLFVLDGESKMKKATGVLTRAE
ncbi:MAG: hypothetical protein AB7T49_18135 [Oligoflexales bacterium]